MKTLADEIYLSEALEALSKFITESEVGNWSETYCYGEDYMHFPDDMSKRLEAAYREGVAYVLGGLA